MIMAYSDFKTLDQINKQLGINIQSGLKLYTHINPIELSSWFIETMQKTYIKAIQINTESARQSLIVDQVLIELGQHIEMSFFLNNSFNVDSSKGLVGNPDGIITKSNNQLYVTSPVVVLVEAKKSDLGSGLAQCIAEMEAARIFNERDNNGISTVYGVVTDGELWRFLSLKNNIAIIDNHSYNFFDGSHILGILQSFILQE